MTPSYDMITPDEYQRLKTLLYHKVDAVSAERMAEIRYGFLVQALQILRSQAPSRSQSLALTHLEESLMRTIQGIALEGEPALPEQFRIVEAESTGGATP